MCPFHHLIERCTQRWEQGWKSVDYSNVNTTAISSFDGLKKTVKLQLSEDIVTDDFDVGFVDGSSIVRLRNKEGLLRSGLD